jgi:hypothetical protein
LNLLFFRSKPQGSGFIVWVFISIRVSARGFG